MGFVKGAKLVAVAGGRRAPEIASEFRVDAEKSIESLLARKDVDAVVLATPDQHRLELTRQAAAAGKHVLVEKPMAPTVAECDAMIAACAAARVNLGVVQTERFRRITRKAKQLVDEGAIGPVWMMRTISSFPIGLTRELHESRAWMRDPRSGGLFMGIASHNTDFLRWISGANAKRVFAQVNTFSDLTARAQSVMAQVAFENGIMGHMWISSEFPSPGIPHSEVRFQIVGRDGILDLENFDFLDLGKGDTWERIFTPEKFDYLKEPRSPIRLEPHVGVIQEFVDSIREGRPPKVGGAEGRAAVEICEACLISARAGQAVELPLTSS
jgi:predicted dehydrogenase